MRTEFSNLYFLILNCTIAAQNNTKMGLRINLKNGASKIKIKRENKTIKDRKKM